MATYLPETAAAVFAATGRPYVTVAYAQSLDGSLTLQAGRAAPVSGEASMRVTHELRAAHDAILCGIGTVLADDPSMTVRLVTGKQPQPIVLDSRLRFPVTARLLQHPRGVWLATTTIAPTDILPSAVTVVRCPPNANGNVALPSLLDELGRRGITSVMVEGGAHVITSFLQSGLVNRIVITIAPVLAGGYRAVSTPLAPVWEALPRLHNMQVEQIGGDLLVWGDVYTPA